MAVRERMRVALREAMKARDKAAVSALRTTLAAIDDAEAVDAGSVDVSVAAHSDIAGSAAGVGATEVQRSELTSAQVSDVIRAAVAERQVAADSYEQAGRSDAAQRLRREVEVLQAILTPAATDPA